MSQLRRAAAFLPLALIAAACAAEVDGEGDGRTGSTAEPLAMSAVSPIDQVYVKGKASPIDVETDYLPHVVCCENGAAPHEALKAQAVMARTYMAYSYFASGLGKTASKPFTGTTSDQAYYCSLQPTQACKDAVNETAGQVTAFTDTKGVLSMNLTFFIDGPRAACLSKKSCSCPKPSPTTKMTPNDHPPDCDCFTWASMGAANPAYVTYNWSNSGADVTRSSIGGADPANRGCASQNIESCLAYAGWSYADQLRFHYGQDIALHHLDGTPVGETNDGGGTPASSGSSGQSGGDGVDPSSGYAPPKGSRDDGDDGGCAVPPGGAPRGTGALVVAAAVAAAFARRRRLLRRA